MDEGKWTKALKNTTKFLVFAESELVLRLSNDEFLFVTKVWYS
jgi:hypothetical protein